MHPLFAVFALFAQQRDSSIVVTDSVVALVGVTVIDGTGAAPRPGQTVVLAGGRIRAMGPSASVTVPAGAKVLDRPGYRLLPGFIGLHDHFFHTSARGRRQLSFTAPRLYLASGVTTARTTGSFSPYADISLRTRIDAGDLPGPRMVLSGPYLTGPDDVPERRHITTPAEAARVVNYWADEGATWFKVYTEITRENLKAITTAAHRRGVKVTGHLCSVGFVEAAEAGIDALEHGLLTNTEYFPDKVPDKCPAGGGNFAAYGALPTDQWPRTFKAMIDHGVSMTSTLAVFEMFVPGRAALDERSATALDPEIRATYVAAKTAIDRAPNRAEMNAAFRRAMDFDVAFLRAGGLLGAGVDPTGAGGVLHGFGDQRNYELLVEAGLTPVEAVKVMTLNGARVLGVEADRGTVAVGKRADLILIEGDPVARPAEIRNVRLVFKDGIGYDSAVLLRAVAGLVGVR